MKFIVGFIILLLIGTIAFAHFYKAPSSDLVLPTVYYNQTPSPISGVDCTADQLSADATFEPAAGNVYGSLTIINISNDNCYITLGNSIKVTYLANNITTNYENKSTTESFLLTPNAKVYSRVHYPNGPQCNGPISQNTTVNISYQNNNMNIMFKNLANGETNIGIAACEGDVVTTVDIWPLSSNPTNL